MSLHHDSPAPLTPRKNTGNHWIGGLVGPEKILMPGFKPRPAVHSSYELHCRGSPEKSLRLCLDSNPCPSGPQHIRYTVPARY